MTGVSIRTFVYDTGHARPGAVLLPLEAVERLPSKALGLEGSVELHLGEVAVLTNESLPMGYVDQWWQEALGVAEALLALRSARWLLPGKVCRVEIGVIPGTRRARVWLQLPEERGGEALSPVAECRVPELAEAMLAEAERFFEWLGRAEPGRDVGAVLARVRALRNAPAPWRR